MLSNAALSAKETRDSLEQPANALDWMAVTFPAKRTEVIVLLFMNAPEPITSTSAGTVTEELLPE